MLKTPIIGRKNLKNKTSVPGKDKISRRQCSSPLHIYNTTAVHNLKYCNRRSSNCCFTYIEPDLGSMLSSQFYCDFRQFLAKKLAFFSKTNVMIKFLHKLALFWVKNAIFSPIFWRKYLKNHNIGPWSSYITMYKIGIFKVSWSSLGHALTSSFPCCRLHHRYMHVIMYKVVYGRTLVTRKPCPWSGARFFNGGIEYVLRNLLNFVESAQFKPNQMDLSTIYYLQRLNFYVALNWVLDVSETGAFVALDLVPVRVTRWNCKKSSNLLPNWFFVDIIT
jgi:hypothetical protein